MRGLFHTIGFSRFPGKIHSQISSKRFPLSSHLSNSWKLFTLSWFNCLQLYWNVIQLWRMAWNLLFFCTRRKQKPLRRVRLLACHVLLFLIYLQTWTISLKLANWPIPKGDHVSYCFFTFSLFLFRIRTLLHVLETLYWLQDRNRWGPLCQSVGPRFPSRLQEAVVFKD